MINRIKSLINSDPAKVAIQLLLFVGLYQFLFYGFVTGPQTRYTGLYDIPLLSHLSDGSFLGYRNTLLLFSSLKHPVFLFFTLAFSIPWLILTVKVRWSEIENGNLLRWFVFAIAFIFAWAYSTYDYNYHVKQFHYWDRLLLIALWLLILWRPTAVGFFLVVALLLASQFGFPVCPDSWTDKKPVLQILVFFLSILALHKYLKIQTSIYFIVAISIQASQYFIPFLNKILIGDHFTDWVLLNQLHLHAVSAHQAGWLSNVSDTTWMKVVDFVEKYSVALNLYAFVIEGAVLVLLWKRNLSIGILFGLSLLHIGIYLESGILFWKFILINLILSTCLIVGPSALFKEVFQVRNLLLSIAIICFSSWLFEPPKLAWYETRFVHHFDFEVQDSSGNIAKIPKNAFAPFTNYFTFERYYFLMNRKIILHSSTSLKQMREVNHSNNSTIKEIIERNGTNQYSNRQRLAFEQLVREYFSAQKEKKQLPEWIRSFQAPHHIMTETSSDYSAAKQIDPVRMKVWFYEGIIREHSIDTVSNECVYEIAL